jgi:hypothetical protein
MTVIKRCLSLENYAHFLEDSYRDSTRKNGLIDFAKKIRGSDKKNKSLPGKYSVKQAQLDHLFSTTVWSSAITGNGHRKLKNVVTHIVLEYGEHANDGNMDPGSVETLFHAIQEHLNILRNKIFVSPWTETPNYRESVKSWLKLR